MNRTTILQVLPSLHSGGVERGTVDIARALVAKNFKSIVVSSGGPMVKEIEETGSTHITLPVHSKNPAIIWKNSKRLIRLVREHNIGLMHVRSRAPAWSVALASRATGIPFVTTFHGAYGHQNSLKRWYNSGMLRGIRTIAVSDFIAKHIAETYPSYAHKSQVIYRGIDTNRYKPELSKDDQKELDDLRGAWNIPHNKRVLLLPGRLTRIKGHELLIQALRQIDTSNLHVLIVGDEPGKNQYKSELIDRINSLGLSNIIHLTGHYSNMKLVYALSDIVISATTKPEAFGRVACEAQAMQKLVIASRHGGSNETISPELRDFMFEPNDVSSLARSIEKILNINELEASDIGIQSRKHIESKFTLEKMCKDTLALYRLELANRSPLNNSD